MQRLIRSFVPRDGVLEAYETTTKAACIFAAASVCDKGIPNVCASTYPLDVGVYLVGVNGRARILSITLLG